MANVTIYTDASVCGETSAAGWGAWIRRGDVIHLTGGCFRRPMADSGKAEMAAVANAVAFAAKHGFVGNGDSVLVVSDSQEVVSKLGRTSSASDSRCGSMISLVRNLALRDGFTVYAKKVKGHSNANGARSFVNRMVDAEARKHMILAREKIAYKTTSPQKPSDQASLLASARTPTPPDRRSITLPLLTNQSPLGMMLDLHDRGWVKLCHVVQTVEIIATHVRMDAPDSFALGCHVVGLVTSPELRARGSSSADGISPQEFTSAFMRRNRTSDVMRETMADPDVLVSPSGMMAAGLFVAQCLKASGHDSIRYQSGPCGPVTVSFTPADIEFRLAATLVVPYRIEIEAGPRPS